MTCAMFNVCLQQIDSSRRGAVTKFEWNVSGFFSGGENVLNCAVKTVTRLGSVMHCNVMLCSVICL